MVVRMKGQFAIGTANPEMFERLVVRNRNQDVAPTNPDHFRQGSLLCFIIEVLDDIGAHDEIHRVRRER